MYTLGGISIVLTYYGIRGVALSMIQNYFTSRLQYTCYNGFCSQMKEITLGVPQGSILGPLFFIIYINDIVNIPLTPNIVLYADDTSLFFSGNSLCGLESAANNWLDQLYVWLSANQLQLNVSKTKYVVFKPVNKPDDCSICIKFNNAVIERTSVFKFLGVLFDENLSFTQHVMKVHSSICKSTGTLFRIRHFVPVWLKRRLYHALIQSHLSYCLLIWGTTCQSNLNRLIILQKRAVRSIENLGYRDHTASVFLKHGLLKITDLYYLRLAIYIRSELEKNATLFQQRYLSTNTQYSFRHDQFRVPFCRTLYGTKQLTYLIPAFINAHPCTISIAQNSKSLSYFKNAMKRYFLSVRD